jgi:hypothetical protein
VINLNAFLVQFPEFASTDINLVESMLAAALLEIDVSVWKAKSDQGQAYLAAHMLAISPFGQNTRLAAKDGATTYWTKFKRLQGIVASGFRVA